MGAVDLAVDGGGAPAGGSTAGGSMAGVAVVDDTVVSGAAGSTTEPKSASHDIGAVVGMRGGGVPEAGRLKIAQERLKIAQRRVRAASAPQRRRASGHSQRFSTFLPL